MFAVDAANDLTHIRIGKMHTLEGALYLATQILNSWDDIYIKEYATDDSDVFKVIVRMSNKGLLV